jgi:hypothetical protein
MISTIPRQGERVSRSYDNSSVSILLPHDDVYPLNRPIGTLASLYYIHDHRHHTPSLSPVIHDFQRFVLLPGASTYCRGSFVIELSQSQESLTPLTISHLLAPGCPFGIADRKAEAADHSVRTVVTNSKSGVGICD